MRGLHQRREDAVERAEHQRLEEQDAQPDSEGTQQRKEVDGLCLRQRLPDPIGDVEQRSDAGNGRGDGGHRLAQHEHLFVEQAENPMQIIRHGKHLYHYQ